MLIKAIFYNLIILILSFMLINNKLAADDSDKILHNIKQSQPQGVISIEQYTGKLLLNPNINTLKKRSLNNKFFIPAMIINQTDNLKLIDEFPMACLVMNKDDLASNQYKSYRQPQVLQYLRDKKNFNATKIIICKLQGGLSPIAWKQALNFNNQKDAFKFDITTSLDGDFFYYYLNDLGDFDMYVAS